MKRHTARAGLAAVVLAGALGCMAPEGATESLASVRQGLTNTPDFVVTALSRPASAPPGSTFQATVTVCNRGDVSGDVEVGLFLSADSNLAMPGDYWAGSVSVGYLQARQCQTRPVAVNASVPNGAWYLGAIADPSALQAEGDETNNTYLSGQLGIGYDADFIVTSVKGPTSVQSGQSLTAQVTVCNQGQQSASTDVAVYLSADATIRVPSPSTPPEDALLGSTFTPSLSPGQCATVAVSGNAWPPPSPTPEGAWYLGAAVDPGNARPELIESNNTNAGYRLGVGYREDFIITSVKGPTSVQSGQSFTAQVTVCNQGQQGGGTDVALYLSADATIRVPAPPNPPEDSQVGGTYTPYLAPGQCATVAVSGSAWPPPSPTPEGAWYLGAVVDPNNGRLELIEDNNTNAGYRLGVGSKADFIVTSVKGPASVQPSQSFTAQVTVCNQGTSGDSTHVSAFLSADAHIRVETEPGPHEDSQVGGTYTPYLAPGQCATVPVSGNAWPPPSPTPEGAWYLGAVVDPGNERPELIEDNNTNAGYRLGVGYREDFIITSVKGPASVQYGQSLTAQVTVCNQGQQGASTNVTLYLSADATIRVPAPADPPEDSQVGGTYTPYLVPGQCTTLTISGSAWPPPSTGPSPGGPYYLGAVVDRYNERPELIEDNNTNAGYRLGMGSKADFIVTSVKGPASVQSGQSLTAQVTVCNQGTSSDSTDVVVVLSADDTFRVPTPSSPPEDTMLGGASLPPLAPGQCATVPVSGNASPPPASPSEGAWYLGAVVDANNMRAELIEDNNTNVGYLLGVGNKADFIVTSVKGPTSVQQGQYFTAQVTVCNQGTSGDSTEVGVYLSADTTLRAPAPTSPPEDSQVGGTNTPYLAPGQCATVPVSGSAWPPSPSSYPPVEAWYLGAVVDPNNGRAELIESNNANAGSLMGVGNKPDFIITSVTGPSSAQSGQTIAVQVTVCNQGTQPAGKDVAVYLSADTTIRIPGPYSPPEDAYVGNAPTGDLVPGQCTTVKVSGPASPPYPGGEGGWYLGAVADPYNGYVELLEDNNIMVGERLGIGNKPDFVITAVTGPASIPGGSFTANVTLCNRGQLADGASVDVYLSADTNVRANVPNQPPEDFFLGSMSIGPLGMGACATKPLVVTAPSMPEGTYYLGAIADVPNARLELIEDNNASAGNRMGVGYRPDFIVSTVTGPNSVRPGATFTANVTLCNQGQLPESVDVDVILSADTTIRLPGPSGSAEDFYLGSLMGVGLGPGRCTTRSVTVTAPSVPEGGWYLGAVVDPYNTRPEFIEDNNASAGNRIGIGNKPDFVVTAVTGPTSVKAGSSFVASLTVCNYGQQGDYVDVELFFSADTTIRRTPPPQPAEDFFLGSVKSIPLGPGACSSGTVTLYANVPVTGPYYLGAIADPLGYRVELIEDNNTKAGTLVSVTP